jgi:antitoxin ParD1/3/4
MPSVEKISIALTTEQISSIKAAVETGDYASTSEVVREALREWQWKRDLRQDELDRLRKLWRAGKASGPARPLNLTAVRSEARRRLKKAASTAA